MRIRSLKLGQLGHTNCHFWQARAALAQKSIRRKPRTGRVLLHILTKSYIDSIMVLGYIAIDVVQATVANLDIDLAHEQHTQKPDKCRYHSSSSAALQPLQHTETYNPSGNVPVWCAASLILGLHAPFIYQEILMARTVRQKEPDAAHKEIHVQCHDVCTSKDTMQIRLKEVWPGKLPFRWCDCDEDIWKRTLPYLTSQIATMAVQLWVMLLVIAPDQHDTHKISKSVANNFPIPGRRLRISRHDVASQSHTFRSVVGIEELVGHALLIQKERKVALFAIRSHTGENLSCPRITNRKYTIGVVFRCILVVLHPTSVTESIAGIQVRKHGTLDAWLQHKEIIRR